LRYRLWANLELGDPVVDRTESSALLTTSLGSPNLEDLEMADETATETAPSRGGMAGKMIAAVVIVLVIVIESVVAFVVTPDPKQIAADVRAEIKAEYEEATPDADLVISEDGKPQVEIELGQFDVAIHDAAADTTYHVMCKVVGSVNEEDQPEFTELLANNQNRMRERIMIEFRSASVADLNEAGLGLIKRRILEKSNALLGKPLIKKVIFPEYNYFVQ
jgi:flagellar basal body-associated protein FliL